MERRDPGYPELLGIMTAGVVRHAHIQRSKVRRISLEAVPLQVLAAPRKDRNSPVKSFYLCASAVFFRPCGKIETAATARGPEESNVLLAVLN